MGIAQYFREVDLSKRHTRARKPRKGGTAETESLQEELVEAR